MPYLLELEKCLPLNDVSLDINYLPRADHTQAGPSIHALYTPEKYKARVLVDRISPKCAPVHIPLQALTDTNTSF